MAETSYPSADNDRNITDGQYEQLGAAHAPNGVLGTPADPSFAYADATGRQVKIRAGGRAWVRGHIWESDPTDDLVYAATPNTSGSPRIDRLVLGLDRDTWNVTCYILEGIPSSSPGLPALTQDTGNTGVYEFPLAHWPAAFGYTTITAASFVPEAWCSHPSGTVLCTSTTRPTGADRVDGLQIYEYDTGLRRRWDGATWAISNSQLDTYTANGTWTKPVGAVSVDVVCVGAGGGGGSGRRGAAGTNAFGGGGGGGGAVSRATFPAAALPGAVGISAGAGGAGAPASTSDDTDGTAGTAGTGASFGTTAVNGANYLRANGGTAGSGGGTVFGGSGIGGSGMLLGSSGGPGGSGTTPATPVFSAVGMGGGTGGGGGGGHDTTNQNSPGGMSGAMFGGVGSAPGGALGLPGDTGVSQPSGSGLAGSGGGGGGGGNNSPFTAGGAGGPGGLYGSGGGGGGGSYNGNSSGAGGRGADGVVIVTTYF